MTRLTLILPVLFLTLLINTGVFADAISDLQKGLVDELDVYMGMTALKAGDYETALKIANRHTDFGSGARLLAILYENGKGVLRYYKAALKWYKIAANKRDDTAQFYLASMYLNAKGTTRNYVRAHMWWNLFATQSTPESGSNVAKNNLDLVEKSMTPSQVETAQQMAREWMERHPQIAAKNLEALKLLQKLKKSDPPHHPRPCCIAGFSAIS